MDKVVKILLGLTIIIILISCSKKDSPTKPRATAKPTITEKPVVISTSATTVTPIKTATLSATPTAIGGGKGKISFLSSRDGNYEIYVMNADGSGQVNLTKNSGEDYNPNWSQDGSKIAFVTNRGGYNDVYVMNADGSSQTRLTNNNVNDYIIEIYCWK